MSSKTSLLEETRLVDVPDKELIEMVGSLFEAIKRLDEAAKNDPEVERLQAELKEYRDVHFLDQKKRLASKLKAARAHARVRNLKFNIPGKAVSDDE